MKNYLMLLLEVLVLGILVAFAVWGAKVFYAVVLP